MIVGYGPSIGDHLISAFKSYVPPSGKEDVIPVTGLTRNDVNIWNETHDITKLSPEGQAALTLKSAYFKAIRNAKMEGYNNASATSDGLLFAAGASMIGGVIQIVKIKAAVPGAFRQRQIELGYNAEQKTADLREGLGAARYEQAVGHTVKRGPIGSEGHGIDIVDPAFGKISLKGPLGVTKTGQSIPITQKMVDGLADSVVKDVATNTATKRVVVDVTGLTDAQTGSLIARIEAGLKLLKQASIKQIMIVSG